MSPRARADGWCPIVRATFANLPECTVALVDVVEEEEIVADEGVAIAKSKAVSHRPPHHTPNHGITQVLEKDVRDRS